jgi:rfaE bifunctional protein nucleotidyltransferase chain/domain
MTAMSFRDKIVPFSELPAWRARQRAAARQVVATNGCFDLLHVGHVTYLEAARALGDCLLVGLNSDASVRALKGPTRPLNLEGDRASVLAALASVDAVCIFAEVDALEFLRVAQPDVYAKGGDYTLDTIHQPERRLVEASGGRVVVLPGVSGRSTTATFERLSHTH